MFDGIMENWLISSSVLSQSKIRGHDDASNPKSWRKFENNNKTKNDETSRTQSDPKT